MEVGTNTSINFILVHIGEHFIEHINDCIEQIKLFNNSKIFVITNESHRNKINFDDVTIFSIDDIVKTNNHNYFIQNNTNNKIYRKGLVSHSVERFFYIEDLMVSNNLTNVFHLENDNLLYVDVSELLPTLEKYYDLATTFDNDSRSIPSFVYIKNTDTISNLNNFINNNIGVSDMSLLSMYNLINDYKFNLPVIPNNYNHKLISLSGHQTINPEQYYNNFTQFKSIFDAAAIGQYIGGVDPENIVGNTVGFINESSLYNPSKFQIEFITDELNRKIPYIKTENELIKINNLHIHCKNLNKYKSYGV